MCQRYIYCTPSPNINMHNNKCQCVDVHLTITCFCGVFFSLFFKNLSVFVCFVTTCNFAKVPVTVSNHRFHNKGGFCNVKSPLRSYANPGVTFNFKEVLVSQDERFVGAEATRVRRTAAATTGLDYWLLSCGDMQPPCHLLVYIIWLRGSSFCKSDQSF